jgi:hypothetical protein
MAGRTRADATAAATARSEAVAAAAAAAARDLRACAADKCSDSLNAIADANPVAHASGTFRRSNTNAACSAASSSPFNTTKKNIRGSGASSKSRVIAIAAERLSHSKNLLRVSGGADAEFEVVFAC